MIYACNELIELKPCKILYGNRDKRRWRPADALLRIDNVTNAAGHKHWLVKYDGKYLELPSEASEKVRTK